MNKGDFFGVLGCFAANCRGYAPAGCRLEENTNYGLDRRMWTIWIVGERNMIKTLVLSLPDMFFVKRYYSLEKANKDLAKFTKWFTEWKNDEKWIL